MEIQSLTNLETELLSELNKLPLSDRTFNNLKSVVPFSERHLIMVLEVLESKNILIFNKTSNCYEYNKPVNGDKVILEGNIMLPTTIIRKPDVLYVIRGAWYKFEPDFDVRRIIWNVQLPQNVKSSTLMDLVRESVLKERKSRIVTLPEYKNLENKYFPYSKNILFKLNAIGEVNTDVNLIFVDILENEGVEIQFRDFSVRSEILTEELIAELQKTPDLRNPKENIKINRLFNFSDFVFANNAIPYAADSEVISYAKITGIKNKIELTFFNLDYTGKVTKLADKEEYSDSTEGIERIKELFKQYANSLLIKNDIMIEF